MKITFLKLGNYTKKNELLHAFIAGFIKKLIFYYTFQQPRGHMKKNWLSIEACYRGMR